MPDPPESLLDEWLRHSLSEEGGREKAFIINLEMLPLFISIERSCRLSYRGL